MAGKTFWVVIGSVVALCLRARAENDPWPSKFLQPNLAETSSLNERVRQLYEAGKFDDAIPLAQKSLDICEQASLPDFERTGTALNNLAALFCAKGDYAQAEPLYRRALEIKESIDGPDHPRVATALNNLAELYRVMGDYAKAEPLFKRSLKIDEKILGPDNPRTATDINNLGLLYDSMGDYVKAQKLYFRTLEIREKSQGPDHPLTATALGNLAAMYCLTGNYAEAERLYRRALGIAEKALGPDHPDTANYLTYLADLYRGDREFTKAEPLYTRALKIDEKALGLDHPETADCRERLAFLRIDLGQAKDAGLLVAQVIQAEERSLANILSFASEPQRLAFQRTTSPYALVATLGDPNGIAQAVLRQKGVVLDSLLEDRLVAEASGDPKQHDRVAQLNAAKQHLMQLILETPDRESQEAQKKRVAEKEKLSAEVEQLEATLARHVTSLGKPRRALTVTVGQVQAAVPAHAVLVELVRYPHYVGNGQFEQRYGAVVIPNKGETRWTPLGSSYDVEKQVRLYRKSARGETDERALTAILSTLPQQIWAPIEHALPDGTTTIIISPDAELNFVSFATLLSPDNRFLGEKYSIRYVASGRDLLRETKSAGNPKTTLRVFANPNFVANRDTKTVAKDRSPEFALRSSEMRDLASISFRDLPGTARESAALEADAKKSGWEAQSNVGSNATEIELRKVNSPRVLHLATHGFFLPEVEPGPTMSSLFRNRDRIPTAKLVNPMHRSGVAFTGAQTTVQAWAKGEVPPTENDGIVTAEEVGALHLSDTWLVVLSACDTGAGEARAGEGVMGLRRGFVQAGTRNLLMTLWPISDETTVQMMLDFYRTAFETENAAQALADTQREWLVKLRREKGLLAAVSLAGPFIMSSQGGP